MRITFAGVGEAFDELLPNTSILFESNTTSLLADCGFTAAPAFWRAAAAPLELDALHISHFHGDHYFGVPALLLRFVEEGRTKPLTILGQEGVETRVRELSAMAYRSFLDRAQFDIHFMECTPDTDLTFDDMRLRFAPNDHPMPCLSIRVDSEGKSAFYSGDGRPTPQTLDLATGCDLIVHESFSLEPDTPGHGTVDSSIDFARQAHSQALALVHVKRSVRHTRQADIEARIKGARDVAVSLPEPKETIDLS